MRTRAFTTREAIIGIAILLVVMACTYPYVAKASARAKDGRCQERLHALAIALTMYRADHDASPLRISPAAASGPWGDWYLLANYLPAPKVVRCPDPSWSRRKPFDHYVLRAIPSTEDDLLAISMPGGIVGYCRNHTDPLRVRSVPKDADLFHGRYPVVREDGSAASFQGSRIEVWGFDGKEWHDKPKAGMKLAWRFPGEPWPPKSE